MKFFRDEDKSNSIFTGCDRLSVGICFVLKLLLKVNSGELMFILLKLIMSNVGRYLTTAALTYCIASFGSYKYGLITKAQSDLRDVKDKKKFLH
jgi:hypothetical protein